MGTQRRISASSFRSLLHCPHSLFLDHHGDPALKTELGEFENYLLDEGKRFEAEVLEGQSYIQPDYPEGDFEAGAEATLDLMAAGHELIYQGVLLTDRFIGIPDLLVKRQGKSSLGKWFYEPREIKTAKDVKDAHVLQVCLYALMLDEIQGRRPQSASVVVADESEEIIDLNEKWPVFEERLAEARAIVSRQTETDFAIFSGCDECPWHDVCCEEATGRQDVTLVAGLRRKVKPQLVGAGILTVSELARRSPDSLLDFRGVGERTAQRLVLQAQSQASGELIRLRKPDLPTGPVELYYDIEGEPNLDLDYLHGLLILERGSDSYESFVAEQPEDEGKAFSEFVSAVKAILDRLPETPIYHYHNYERTHVRKLFERHPDQVLAEARMLDRFIDLHRVLTASVVLPVESYGLKPVSKWLGFRYRNTRSSAAQSMLWYRLWLDTQDRRYLDDSIVYNEDDCRATKLIKEWLSSANRLPQPTLQQTLDPP